MLGNEKLTPLWRRLLLALLIIAAASALRALFFAEVGRGIPYLTYYPAVMLVAVYGGLPAGWLATALSAALAFFWIQRGFMSPVEAKAMMVFCGSGVAIAFICEPLRRAHKQAKLAQDKTEAANQKLQKEIARHQQTEAVLEQSETRFRQIVASIEDVLYSVDSGNREFNYISPVFGRMLGYTRDDVTRMGGREKFLAEVIQGGQFEEQRAVFQKLQAAPTDSPPRWQAWWRCQDGRLKFIEDFWLPIYSQGGLQFTYGVLRDITERKQAEMALQESDTHYRSLFDNMLNGFAYCRVLYEQDRPLDFVYLAVNDAFGTQTGLKDVVGRKVSEVIPGIRENDPELLEIYGRVARTGKPEKLERYVESMQMWFDIMVYSPRKDHFAAVFDVITERKQAEKTLHQLNRLYALLSRVNELIIRSHSDQELFQGVCAAAIQQGGFKLAWIGLVNEETKQVLPVALTGDAADYVKGLQIYSDERPEGRGPTGICIRTGRAYICNDYSKDPNTAPWHEWARLHRIRACASIPFHRGDKIAGALMIYNDEVNCFEAQDVALLEEIAKNISFALDNLGTQTKARQLSRVVEQAAESIVITDTRGIILYVNPAFEKSSGYSRTEALGQNSRLLKSGKQDAGFYREMWAAITHGESWSGHFFNKRKDGTLYEEDATISPVRDGKGVIVNYAAVKHDVTRERQLDAQLRQSQKMEAIGTLAGGVAHDFNNILAIISMQASLLKGGGGLSAQQATLADEIGIAVERATGLTRQLLLFGRKENLQMCDLELNQAVTDLAKMLRRILNESVGHQLKLAGQPMLVHADQGMMDQVLMNLAVNARDAMPNGGQLIIETAGVEFSEDTANRPASARPGSFVCLSVIDTGYGIPADLLPRIFEPFFTTKGVGKGSGLGLSTVFGIVQQHQGWINVESKVGQGTAFRIYLPRRAGQSVIKPTPKMPAATPTGKETILLAEDEPELRIILKTTLTKLGYHVLEAGNGVQALEVWQQHRAGIRLLLTDMMMPDGMTGRDLAQRLLQDAPKLKVVYMSGYSHEVIGQDFQLHEGVNFLAKPFQPQQLAQIIRDRLDQAD